MFEVFVIALYFALLALPVVGIVVGLRYFPPDLPADTPPEDERQ